MGGTDGGCEVPPQTKMRTRKNDAWHPQFKAKTSRYTKNEVVFSVPCAYARGGGYFEVFHCLRVPTNLSPVNSLRSSGISPGAPGPMALPAEGSSPLKWRIFPGSGGKQLKSALFREKFPFISGNVLVYREKWCIL